MDGGDKVPNFGYVDDSVLLADSPEGLQRLLDATSDVCDGIGMMTCVQKTKTMVLWHGCSAPLLASDVT